MRSSKYGLGLAVAAASVAFGTSAASADVVTADFEAPTFTPGNINGQDGWKKTGPYDAEVVTNAGAPAAFGGQSLRISNAVTNGSFDDQTFSKPLANEAGEAFAAGLGQTGGTRQTRFVSEWSFASRKATEQPGLAVTASPDDGAGARMSFIRMSDTPTGLKVDFVDYDEDLPGNANNKFVETTVATDLPRTTAHTVRLEIDFRDGRENDVVKVFVDNVLEATGNSWEDYFRDGSEQAARGNLVPTIDSVLYRVSSNPQQPATLGDGLLIDGFRIESSTPPPPPGPAGGDGSDGADGADGARGPQGPAGATGPQGSSGTQGTSGLTPSSTTTGKVSLISKSLKVSKTRKVTVSISCPTANRLCEGRLNLLKGRKIIARQAFLVRGGRSGKVTFTLSRKAYKALKKSQRMKVDSFSRDLAGAASESSKTLTLTK